MSRQGVIHTQGMVVDSTTVVAVAPNPDVEFAYSDAQWQAIKDSLVCVGIDADAVTVGDRWWAQPYPEAAITAEPRQPLREQLGELAADYRGAWAWPRPLTLKQELARVREGIDALERACAVLTRKPRVGAIVHATSDVLAAMGAPVARLKRHRDKLQAALNGKPHFRLEAKLGSQLSGSDSARKTHTVYWDELVLLWWVIVPRRKQQRGLARFLHACSTPAFEKQTTATSVRSFLDRKKRIKRRSKKRVV